MRVCLLIFCGFLIAGCNSSARKGLPTVDLLEEENASPTPTATATPSVSRPTDVISINAGSCSCLNKKRDSLGNCDSFCSTKEGSTPVLYGSVNLAGAPDVALNAELGNLYGWCNNELTNDFDENGQLRQVPGCVIEAFDGLSTLPVTVTTFPGSNNFTADVSGLEINKVYTLRIVEVNSGSNARTNAFQIRRLPPPTDSTPEKGPLKIMPIHKYTCVNRSGGTDANGDIFENAIRFFYYYEAANDPPTLPPGDNFLFCHDINVSVNDSPNLARLELEENSFYAWNFRDSRLGDANGNNIADVNELIKQKLEDEYNIIESTTKIYFTEFTWPSSPETQNTPTTLGHIMVPFINTNTDRAYCPTQDEYNGTSPLFKVFRELVGVDTEGVYLAEKEPETFVNDQGEVQKVSTPPIIVTESLLKQIGYYVQNGTVIPADDSTLNSKTIKFYYPADTTTPFTRKAYQKIYTVRAPKDIGSDVGTVPSFNTGLATSDNRFGCVPKYD